MPEPFRVGITSDFLKADGTLTFGDIGLGVLDEAPNVAWEFMKGDGPELAPEVIQEYDGIVVLDRAVTWATVEGAPRLKIVARFGVGYDRVDVDACTENNVLLTITPDGVRRPVATAAITFMLTLAQKVWIKDKLTREGRWDDRLDHVGIGLTGRTLGIVGLGNIGREIARLAKPFDVNIIAYDPYADREAAEDLGVRLSDLNGVLATSDFLVLSTALTEETRGMIGAEQLRKMKPTAFLINVARGPLVDQRALTEALRGGVIQGAALDVFDPEPVDPNDPILKLDNVIVTPHSICWTDECFLGMGEQAMQSVLDVAAGRVPKHVVNPAAATTR